MLKTKIEVLVKTERNFKGKGERNEERELIKLHYLEILHED